MKGASMNCPCGRPLDNKGAKGLCHKCYEKARYKQNPERTNKINAAYYARNREKSLATQRAWRERNKEKIAADNKLYATQNKEKISEYQKQYRQDNHTELYKKSVERKFGITVNKYRSLLRQQKGVCAICDNPPEGKKKKLCVDHNHDTGVIRGLLCSKCNLALGLFEDDITTLSIAINYLKKYRKASK